MEMSITNRESTEAREMHATYFATKLELAQLELRLHRFVNKAITILGALIILCFGMIFVQSGGL